MSNGQRTAQPEKGIYKLKCFCLRMSAGRCNAI
jgi:hypothetical protein